MMRVRTRLLVLVLSIGGISTSALAASYTVIVCGSGGAAEYDQKFLDWGRRLEKAWVEKFEEEKERVFLLVASDLSDETREMESSLESIKAVFQTLANRMTAQDSLFVFLIGHGSYQNGVSRFMVPGPDLTAQILDGLLDRLEYTSMTLVNAASSGSGFINVLSGEGRIVCTATKSAEERNATEFMEHFVTAIEQGVADLNRDDRISALEACESASALTQEAYEDLRLIASEHALLDDNGDGLGARLPLALGLSIEGSTSENRDGEFAATVFLKDYSFQQGADPESIEAYLSALRQVEELKGRKAVMELETYYRDLEALLLQAARANREIREATEVRASSESGR